MKSQNKINFGVILKIIEMSDNLYSRGLADKPDIDLWQMSFARTDQNCSQRRKVEFDVRQRVADPSASTSIQRNTFNESMANQFTKDMSEPEMKIAVIVLESVNNFTQHFLIHPFIVIRRQSQVLFATFPNFSVLSVPVFDLI